MVSKAPSQFEQSSFSFLRPPQPVAPPKLGKAVLAKAPEVWHGTRDIVDKNIEALKKAVRGEYAHEHPDLLKEIDDNMEKLDGILDKLDHRLADSLAKAHAAKDEAAGLGDASTHNIRSLAWINTA